MVSLRFPKESLLLSPGFYMALGNEELVHEEAQTLVRWYWNLTATGAVCFLRKATLMLNRARLPYKLKVLNDPARFTRCDTVVLYIRKAECSAVSQILAEVYPEVAADMKPGIPVFTKRLAPGVALAEDPGQGESFGLHRCRLLSEGMIRAHEQSRKSLEDRLECVEDCLAKESVRLDEPFLNLGSRDDYSFSLTLPGELGSCGLRTFLSRSLIRRVSCKQRLKSVGGYRKRRFGTKGVATGSALNLRDTL